MEQIIGRQIEKSRLAKCVASGKPEFVVICGRRRIGKTFLVRQFFDEKFAFSFVGVKNKTFSEQILSFALALAEYGWKGNVAAIKNWFDAFRGLRELIESQQPRGRKVVFIDEMPWIDTAKSSFVTALEDFWNGWAAYNSEVMLVTCGSATSWMTEKIIHNHGGLHNRITEYLFLEPFTLNETEQYLNGLLHCNWKRELISQCYMVLGGVPYYLSKISPSQGVEQNIDRLMFSRNGLLRHEFDELYNALYNNAHQYIAVVSALAKKRNGMTRVELSSKTHIEGGTLTSVLKNLERNDFIRSFARFGKVKSKVIYRLTDFYTLFYLKFVDGDRSGDEQRWSHMIGTGAKNAWRGLSFELLALLHINQIKQRLGIGGMFTEVSSWRSDVDGEQIDLLIDRVDNIVNVCEMKFTDGPFVINKAYATHLQERMENFAAQTHCRKSLLLTMVTSKGVTENQYSHLIQSRVSLDDLFEPYRTY